MKIEINGEDGKCRDRRGKEREVICFFFIKEREKEMGGRVKVV